MITISRIIRDCIVIESFSTILSSIKAIYDKNGQGKTGKKLPNIPTKTKIVPITISAMSIFLRKI